MRFPFTKYRKICYIVSGFLVMLSIAAILFLGIVPGIEFVGGSMLEARYEEEPPSMEEVRSRLAELDLGETQVRPLGEDGVLVRTTKAEEEVYEKILGALGEVKDVHFESIGPTVGEELRNMSIVAILLASLLVIIYIAVSFRDDDGRVSSAKYGFIAAGVAFFHDILILVGLFAFLGHFLGVQVTIPIAVALLTTLGYSINDTVVIFDRIRENLSKEGEEKNLKSIVDISLNETLGRSLSTSFTTLLVLFSLLFFGGATLFYFVLALIVGIVLGTYSSLFLAGSLVLDWNTLTERDQ